MGVSTSVHLQRSLKDFGVGNALRPGSKLKKESGPHCVALTKILANCRESFKTNDHFPQKLKKTKQTDESGVPGTPKPVKGTS